MASAFSNTPATMARIGQAVITRIDVLRSQIASRQWTSPPNTLFEFGLQRILDGLGPFLRSISRHPAATGHMAGASEGRRNSIWLSHGSTSAARSTLLNISRPSMLPEATELDTWSERRTASNPYCRI